MKGGPGLARCDGVLHSQPDVWGGSRSPSASRKTWSRVNIFSLDSVVQGGAEHCRLFVMGRQPGFSQIWHEGDEGKWRACSIADD